ncbi:MAG: methionine biosynthesis protein MetW, partial [Chloroflexota bacterium]
MQSIKQHARDSFIRPVYLWLANRYRKLLRLFTYPATASVGRVDYDAYWDEKFAHGMGAMSEWRLKRAKVFASLVTRGDTVLDLGVGDGALLRFMIDEAGITGRGLDISPKAVEFCRAHGLDVDLADVNTPMDTIVKQQYDYVVLSEIIEHIPDPEQMLIDLRPF